MFKSYLILSVLFLSGCVSSSDMVFTVVAVSSLNETFKVVEAGVSGESCGTKAGSYGSYQEATDNAINSAPGANALVNARFTKVEKILSRICVKVTGDAVTI